MHPNHSPQQQKIDLHQQKSNPRSQHHPAGRSCIEMDCYEMRSFGDGCVLRGAGGVNCDHGGCWRGVGWVLWGGEREGEGGRWGGVGFVGSKP